MKATEETAAWLPDPPWIPEAFEPEAYDSGQRKRYLRCEHERLHSLLNDAEQRVSAFRASWERFKASPSPYHRSSHEY